MGWGGEGKVGGERNFPMRTWRDWIYDDKSSALGGPCPAEWRAGGVTGGNHQSLQEW